MSRSYPAITLWLLENPFDIITLWQLQEGKCSISSPTSTLFWEPGASLFSTFWSAKCLWGSVWGALLISAPETCQGLRVSNQSRGFRRVAVRGRAMGLLLPVCWVENYSSTREEYLVLSERPLEHFPPFCLHYNSIYKRSPLWSPHWDTFSSLSHLPACEARVIFYWLLPVNQAWCLNPTEPYGQTEHLVSIQGFEQLISKTGIWYSDSCWMLTMDPESCFSRGVFQIYNCSPRFPQGHPPEERPNQTAQYVNPKPQGLSNREWRIPRQNFRKIILVCGTEALCCPEKSCVLIMDFIFPIGKDLSGACDSVWFGKSMALMKMSLMQRGKKGTSKAML